MWRVRGCNIIVGEQVTTQHKPHVSVLRKQKRKEDKVVGRNITKWWE